MVNEVTITLDENGEVEIFGVKNTLEVWAKIFQSAANAKDTQTNINLKYIKR